MELESTSPELIVCQALRAATDPNHEVVRKAEEKLREWEQQPGFFPTLVRIFQNQQLEVNVRWMAAVYLKNGVNQYWRRNVKHELPPEEKQQIREMLLSNLAEPIPQVALQIAVLVSKIARIDCPRDWPHLMPELLKMLQDCTEDQKQRVLLVLYHVVKALASKRMMADKRVFEELTANIFGYIYELWDGFTNLYFHQLNSNCAQELTIATMEKALLTLRILRKLTIFGFNKPHNSPQCMQFLELIFGRLKQCLECRYELQRMQAHETLLALTEKFILKQMKILNEFLDMHAKSFVRFFATALAFSFNYVFHDGAYLIFSQNVINFRHFAIHCINLMKGILLCERDDATRALLTEFFSRDRLCYICEKIMTHYFLLTQIELDLWSEDPEGFAQDDGGESWKYSLRPCVESLFVTLMPQFHKEAVTEVVKYINKAQQIQLSAESDLKDILLKDAIYNAAGVASFHLFNEIDFDAWFSTQLLAELKIESDNFRILRRRIIWLVSEWAGVKLARELRPIAYEACLHLLRPIEDMSIRLAASKTLYRLIVDFDFAPEGFLPYLEVSFQSLFVLLREAKECDTKLNVLTSMSLIVEKMSDHIEQHADNLISYLPMLWKESEDYDMLRCAIICTLQQLVKAIRDIPEAMKPFLYSVIELSTNLQEPSHIYLMEEGLVLWQSVVENSTCLSAKLHDLCQLLLPIIEMSSENLRHILVLIQAYILLDARAYLERYGRGFVDFCTRAFDDIRPEGIVLMLKVFETCLKAEPNYGLELVRPALPYIFKQVYANKEYPMLMSMYLMMVARVLLIDQSVFMNIVHSIQQPNALETILDVWITKMPLVTEVEKRKLFCLAFCSIFSNNAIVLERFPGIMQNISETLKEVVREEEDEADEGNDENSVGGGGDDIATSATTSSSSVAKAAAKVKYCDCLVFIDEHDLDTSSYALDDFDYKTYHYDRCRQLSLKDPVHKIVLTDCVEWQLGALRAQLGDQSYQQLMHSVYPGVLEKMSEFVKLGINFVPSY